MRSRSPGRPRGVLLTCPQLPGPLTIYLAPSHRTEGQPTCKTERHRNYSPGRTVGLGSPDLFLSQLPSLLSFFPVALCVSLQVSLYCTDTLFAKPYAFPRHYLARDRAEGPQRLGGGERGRVGRWLAVAVAFPIQRGGGGG